MSEESCFNFWKGHGVYLFAKASRLALRHIQPYVRCVPGVVPRSKVTGACHRIHCHGQEWLQIQISCPLKTLHHVHKDNYLLPLFNSLPGKHFFWFRLGIFLLFSHFLEVNFKTITQIRARFLPSISKAIYYLLNHSPSNAGKFILRYQSTFK